MTLRNPKLFGLNILSFLADVENKNAALTALNLPSLDLDVIRGSSDAGATRHDWISFSRLKVPIYKTLDRFSSESSSYLPILQNRAGTDSILFGNLGINGSLSGNAIRYRYIDGTGSSASVKIADISTSRVSAWSSSASPVIDTSPISYGARVGIITGGSLQFGTPASSGQTRIQTSITPQVKEFNSEFPTSKINFTIGGQTVTLYAMKGIPLIFKGFFRRLNAAVTLTGLINETPASWKIVDTSNPNVYTNYANRGGLTSSINYRSSRSRERFIQFYYNPDNISSITLTSANIAELPVTRLENISTLNFSSNILKNFPDFNFFSPNLRNLYISNNPFYLSETSTERKLNVAVLSKIPTGLRELVIGRTFYGSIPVNAIGNRFPQLTRLDLSRGGGPYFHPDDDDPNSTIPNVPQTCETYNVTRNDFRSIGSSSGSNYNVKELDNLVSLSLASNYYLTDAGFSISTNNTVINSVNISRTGLPIPDLSTKQSLQSFSGTYTRNAGSFFTGANVYKFDGCGSLGTLNLYASAVSGAMPKFTNASLSYLDLRITRISGGDPNGDTTYVIPERTFEQAPNLQYFLFQSGSVLSGKPIHPNAFTYTPSLYYLWYSSSYRTNGNFPSISVCSNLNYLVCRYNSFTGTIPNLATNPNIYYVDFRYNQFSGNIPAFKNLSRLTYLYLFNNQFTGLLEFQNLPNLVYFYAHNNQITGELPDFGDCPRLYYLILFNNQFTNYKSGALSQNYRLRYLDISGNNLTQQAVNKLIEDLYTNYTTVNRGGVTINLRGNALPSGDALDTIDILRSKGWTIVFE
jgi:Leucine-rich repeat (LRR) protein